MNRFLALFFLCFVFSARLFAQPMAGVVIADMPVLQKADTLLKMAQYYRVRSKEDSSALALSLAKPFVFKAQDAGLIIKYYQYNALLLHMRMQEKEMIAELRKSLPYFPQANNYSIQANTLYFFGIGYSRLKQYDSAQHYFSLAEKKYDLFNPYLKWNVKSSKAMMFQEADNLKLAEQYFLEAYTMTKEKGIRMDHGVMLNYMLSFYNYTRQYEKYAAIQVELMDFKKKGLRNKTATMAVHQVDFGDLEKKSFSEKILFLEAAKKQLLAAGDTINAAFTNSTLSSLHEKNNQPLLALPYMQENIVLTKGESMATTHFAYSKAVYRLLLKAGKTEEASRLFDYLFALKDSISHSEKNKQLLEWETIYQTEKKQQEIYVLNAEKELSKRQIEILQLKTQGDSLVLLQEAEKRKALFKESLLKETALLEQQKNFNLLAMQNLLMDSIVQSEQAYNTLLQNENELKQAELNNGLQLKNALAREVGLQKEQLKKERQIKWGFITGSVLLLLSGLLVFKFYRNQKKKNHIIEKQSADLEVLMREIHHRVKNNLQVVSSLLDLQSHSISDVQAHEAVKEGKNRVQSMALIHQNLYSEGNVKGIRLKEYVSNLIHTLSHSYNITNDKIKITASIDDLNLDVDTMIPIGLVLNELISNSFKYAFKEKQNGELTILLQQQARKLHLMVSDNGSGFPEGLDVKDNKTFGLKMVRAFSQKLKATLEIYNNDGAVVEMQISKYKTA